MSEETSLPDDVVEELEIGLQDVNGLTPDQVLYEEGVKLPLPDEDRAAIERAIKKNQRLRLSLIELMLLVLLLCVLMGLTRWMPFDIYTVALGCLSAFLLIFDNLLSPRYRTLTIGAILSAYLISAAWLVITG